MWGTDIGKRQGKAKNWRRGLKGKRVGAREKENM